MMAGRTPWMRRTAALALVMLLWALPFFSLHLTHHAFESEPDCAVSQIALSGAGACPAVPSLALPAAALAQTLPPPRLRLEKHPAHPQARAPPPERV